MTVKVKQEAENNANAGADAGAEGGGDNGSENNAGANTETGTESGATDGGETGTESGEGGNGDGDLGEGGSQESPELIEARAQIQTLTSERDTAIAERDAALAAKKAAEELLAENKDVVASALEKDLGQLTDEQKATLAAEVGDDPMAQHKQLQFMRRMGMWPEAEPEGQVYDGLSSGQEGAPDKPKSLKDVQKRVEQEYRSGKKNKKKRK